MASSTGGRSKIYSPRPRFLHIDLCAALSLFNGFSLVNHSRANGCFTPARLSQDGWRVRRFAALLHLQIFTPYQMPQRVGTVSAAWFDPVPRSDPDTTSHTTQMMRAVRPSGPVRSHSLLLFNTTKYELIRIYESYRITFVYIRFSICVNSCLLARKTIEKSAATRKTCGQISQRVQALFLIVPSSAALKGATRPNKGFPKAYAQKTICSTHLVRCAWPVVKNRTEPSPLHRPLHQRCADCTRTYADTYTNNKANER